LLATMATSLESHKAETAAGRIVALWPVNTTVIFLVV
jgi:hypothetical protein